MWRYIRAIGLVSLLTLATNLLAFLRELLMARSFGITPEADSFIAAFTIVSFLFLVFTAGTLQSVFMPTYQGLIAGGAKDKAFWLSVHTSRWLLLLLGSAVLVLVVTSGSCVRLLVPGFSEEQQALTSRLVLILSPMAIIVGMGSVMQSILHAHQRFAAPSLVPCLNNVAIIIFLLFVVPVAGVKGLAVGYVVGACMWWVLLLPMVLKYFRGVSPSVDRAAFSSMLIRLGPLILLIVADQISGLIQKTLASSLPTGSIAALNYAAKLEGLPVGIFAAAIATVAFPAMVEAIERKEVLEVVARFRAGLTAVFSLALPAMVFICLFSKPIVSAFLERGAFDRAATEMTSDALFWYALGIVPQCLIVYLNKVYFAARNTRLPTTIGVISAAIHVIICWAAVRSIGYVGIAIGTTLYAVIYSILLFVYLRRVLVVRLNDFLLLWKPAVSGVAMLCSCSLLNISGDWRGLLLAAMVGTASFCITYAMLHIPSFLKSISCKGRCK